jgi:hypothetical protein
MIVGEPAIFVVHPTRIFELTPCRDGSCAARIDRLCIVAMTLRGT